MIGLKTLSLAVFLGFCLFSGQTVAGESQVVGVTRIKTDRESGLKIAPGWETVKTNCTGCHSARLIVFQKGDRDTWLAIIRWMQKTQGLWNFDKKTGKYYSLLLVHPLPSWDIRQKAKSTDWGIAAKPLGH